MKSIVFKIGHFPITSETFIVNHITKTIEMGFEVKILVQKLLEVKKSNYQEIFSRYDLEQKIVIQDYNIPKKRSKRILRGFIILLSSIGEIGALWRYYKVKKKINLSVLYEWHFFRKFRDTDLFHVQYGTNSKPLDDLKKSGYFKMPLIVTFHGHDSFFPINGFIQKEGYYDRLFEEVDLVTVNTPYLERQLKAIDCPPEKITVIPMPVNCNFFKPVSFIPLDQKNIKLLSVGRLEPIKGHKYGILAVKELVKKGYGINYKIIGDGSTLKQLENLVNELGLERHVEFLGALPQEKILKFYYNADILLMTSVVVNGDTRETQGLVSLEAQACGLPVVAFRSGGVCYTVKEGETGVLIDERDYEKFAEAIEELINKPQLLEQMASKAPVFIEKNFSTRLISGIWKRKYESLLDRKVRNPER